MSENHSQLSVTHRWFHISKLALRMLPEGSKGLECWVLQSGPKRGYIYIHMYVYRIDMYYIYMCIYVYIYITGWFFVVAINSWKPSLLFNKYILRNTSIRRKLGPQRMTSSKSIMALNNSVFILKHVWNIIFCYDFYWTIIKFTSQKNHVF